MASSKLDQAASSRSRSSEYGTLIDGPMVEQMVKVFHSWPLAPGGLLASTDTCQPQHKSIRTGV